MGMHYWIQCAYLKHTTLSMLIIIVNKYWRCRKRQDFFFQDLFCFIQRELIFCIMSTLLSINLSYRYGDNNSFVFFWRRMGISTLITRGKERGRGKFVTNRLVRKCRCKIAVALATFLRKNIMGEIRKCC